MIRSSYGPMQKTLHWVVFVLVVLLYGITYGEEFFPRGDPGRAWIWWLHISFGLLLAAVIIIRILTRMRLGSPASVSSVTPVEENVARVTHFLLYALLVAVVTIGIVLTFYRDNPLATLACSQFRHRSRPIAKLRAGSRDCMSSAPTR